MTISPARWYTRAVMKVVSIADVLSGKVPVGEEVEVRGWVRTRRDSKAGLSFIHLSDGSGFAPLQLPADGPRFAELFHGDDERISVAGLRWGVSLLHAVVRRLCA